MLSHRIKLDIRGGGTSEPPPGYLEVERGSGYLMRFRPSPGYRVAEVYRDGAPQGAQKVFFIPHVLQDTEVVAEFRLSPYSHLSGSSHSNLVDARNPSATPQHSGITLGFTASATKEPVGLKAELFNAQNSVSVVWESGKAFLTYRRAGVAGESYEQVSESFVSSLDLVVSLSVVGDRVSARVGYESGVEVVSLSAVSPEGYADGWKYTVDSWDPTPAGAEVVLREVVQHSDASTTSVLVARQHVAAPGCRRVPGID